MLVPLCVRAGSEVEPMLVPLCVRAGSEVEPSSVPLSPSLDGTVIVWDQRMAGELWRTHERCVTL